MTALFDFEKSDAYAIQSKMRARRGRKSPLFSAFKRGVDLAIALPLVALTALVAVPLVLLNPRLNPGQLFFKQTRMGRNCEPFKVYKFRTMTDGDEAARSPDCPLELDRITPLGRWMRRFRVDELPQALNVLRGEMSLIGPRPDAYHHAQHFLKHVPGYADRHAVRPGISGLAQIELGYVEGTEATRRKVEIDLFYIQNMTLRLEAYVFWRSIVVILRSAGT